MAEIFRSTLRSRGLRGTFLALLVFLGLSAALLAWANENPNPTFVNLLATIYAIVAVSGLIGCDVSDGTVQLVLGRPLTRNQYLAGRGLGAAVLALGGGLVVVASTILGVRLRGPIAPEVDLGGMTLTLMADLLWLVAVCLALSTLVPGRGDVVVYVLLVLSGLVMGGQANNLSWPWLSAAFYWWGEQIDNGLALIGGPSPLIWHDLVRWSSNLVAVLFLGSVVFNRKEFSYGAS